MLEYNSKEKDNHSKESYQLLEKENRKDKMDLSQIISELRDMLLNYLKENTHITANGFCSKNSLSSTTVNNLLNGKTQKKISTENIRKIVFGIHRGKPIEVILREAKGHVGELLRKSFEGLHNVKIEAGSNPVKESYLHTREGRIISVLAHNKGGTTKREIANTLDGFALETLDKMLKDKVLKQDENGRITGISASQYLDSDITKEMIRDMAYYLKPSESHKGLNKFKILSSKLSLTQRQRQKEIIDRAVRELTELYSNEDESGEHSFLVLGTDTLTQPDIDKGEES